MAPHTFVHVRTTHLHHQRKVQGPESAGFIRSPEDLSVGPSVINRSSPESAVRRIYPEDYPYGSSPEDLSVGPSVINRSRTIRN